MSSGAGHGVAERALDEIASIAAGSRTANSLPHIERIARAALGPVLDGALTFGAFRAANVARCLKWHPAGLSSWSPSDWLTAAMGELGELASEVKTFNRERDGLAGNKQHFTPEERQQRMANEAADVVTYVDLFCAERGIDLAQALVRKFNEVSERVGFPDRIALAHPLQNDHREAQ